ncbi:MAG: hypothetical protein HND52_09560 [Ignavibacteriae bacterium]|nr:hypothetical protein [Ignavibacteriota bacterium]NOG98196.1 hypothetical protein [Ignavibacteriota bacterium]
MDLKKEYINQALTTASHNLRLTSEKIEVVAILKEYISKNNNVSDSIVEMKKITELSKFAIKLGDVNNYINSDKIDFIKLSEKFKEQSHNLIIELSSVLDKVTPDHLRELLDRTNKQIEEESFDSEPEEESDVNGEIKNDDYELEEENYKSASDILKESIIMEDLPEKVEQFDFKDFEDSILKPIREMDGFLDRLSLNDYNDNEISEHIFMASKNAASSKEIGFDILSNMNSTIAAALTLVKDKKIKPDNNTVENLRACLIVVVAVVRGKDVDITDYLNRAEKFGKEITEKV